MSPLVSETATTPLNATILSAETAYISASPRTTHMIAANDDEQPGKRSLLERRRKRWARRAAH